MRDDTENETFLAATNYGGGTSFTAFQQSFLSNKIQLAFDCCSTVALDTFLFEDFSNLGPEKHQPLGTLGSMIGVDIRG